jgi:nitrite reductase/ring-hydroxylating ferredoxin subunit
MSALHLENDGRSRFLLFALQIPVLLRFIRMQSFNTRESASGKRESTGVIITVGRVDQLPPNHCVAVDLSDGRELALYNVSGEFYATSNFCPHKGAPLSEGKLCGHVIECDWHGWRFDVRTGVCEEEEQQVETYRVFVEDQFIKIEI